MNMQRQIRPARHIGRAWAAIVLVASCWAGSALAQTGPAAVSPAAAPAIVPAVPQDGIQGQSIFEVRPDAAADPKYMAQSNAERIRVQPGNNAPMWRAVGSGVQGYSSLPLTQAPEAGVLVQPFVQYPGSRYTTAGQAWREARNHWIIPYGGSLFLIVLLAIGIFYFTKGTMEQHSQDTGRKIERFTPFERATHWTNAIAFVILALSGVVMAFGKFLLLPIMGGALFGWLTYALKNMHNFVGPLFAVSLVLMFFTFLRDNWPQRGDLHWIKKAGGMFGKPGDEPPSHRFNAGEKFVFWGGVFLLGTIVIASGLVLDQLIPSLVYLRETMQVANMVHAVASLLMLCVFAGHIYLGTIGMRGSYSAMHTGYVDEAWAKEHHRYWYDDVRAGKIPVQRSRQPLPEVAGI